MQGKVCVITGANSGIGKATAIGLGRQGAHTVLVCRNPEKGAEALEDVRAAAPEGEATLIQGDLGTLASTRALADRLRDDLDRVDVLINNAGVWVAKRQDTPDGFELTFAVNHLAPFLLTQLLLDKIESDGGGRIVNLSSDLHYRGHLDFDDLHRTRRRFRGMSAYSDSKLCNVLYTRRLAERLEGRSVTVNAVHPGVVNTNLTGGLEGAAGRLMGVVAKAAGPLLLTPEKGARTSIYLASSPDVADVSGEYFHRDKPKKPSREARDDEVAERLWAVSEALTGLEG